MRSSGAREVLVYITGGEDMGLMEVDEATSVIYEEAGDDANIIFGAVIDPEMNDELNVTVIATGFNKNRHDISRYNQQTKDMASRPIEPQSEKDLDIPAFQRRQQNRTNPGNEEKQSGENRGSQSRMDFDDDLDVPAFIRKQMQ